jgi:hypothetical protein
MSRLEIVFVVLVVVGLVSGALCVWSFLRERRARRAVRPRS